MTVAFDLRPQVCPPELGREEVRRGLTALLRRRVPGQEVDDLAQTILCDALASSSIPSDPEELRRWLIGIARHKIADYHRRTARRDARSDGEAPLASCASAPAAFEEREVLHRLLGALESRRDAETMEWLVREHGGERLADIAAENGLPATAVRQRVSRLRRALRSRYAGAAFVLLLFVGAATALGISRSRSIDRPAPAVTPIVPDCPVPPVRIDERNQPAPAPLLERVQGDWVVQTVTPERELTEAERRFVDVYSRSATMHVEGGAVTVKANAFAETWQVTGTEGARIILSSAHGEKEVAEVVVRPARTGTELELRLPNHPRLAGKLVLKRPVY